MTTQGPAGRVNQKQRTRTAIVDAARELVQGSVEVTMPLVARTALVSEATAYRYFPDLVTLLREALDGTWPSSAEAMAPVQACDDPVERVAYATDYLLRHVLRYQGAVRAMISVSIVRPDWPGMRPGYRFGLIDEALRPLDGVLQSRQREALQQLRQRLAIVVSAEALFILTDLCGLAPEDAIATAVHAARAITAAALAEDEPHP